MKSPTASSLTTISNLNKINKHSSTINQQDSSLSSSAPHSDINQDFNEKKFIIVSLLIDFIFFNE
jgi:hypothetical protein